MHLKEGSFLQGGRYRIERMLGQGGFGVTYLGMQTGLNRKVAIKEFFMKEYCNREKETSHVSVPSMGSKDLVERFRQKFVKEAQTISELDNHHIVRIHDVFEENETAYYVMEYLPGGDLRSRIPKSGMPETEALSYIRQIADALMFVHERNILHLDIKPSNVLFRSNGEAVLVDFGLSKHYDETSGDQTSSTPLGLSEGYAPTEQYECGGVSSFSPATDIYSLGATFYCLLQGGRPPKASIVLNDGLPALPSHVSAPTRKAIEAAMQSRSKDRPQSVYAFLSLLDSSLENEDEETVVDVASPAPKPVPQSRRWLFPILVCLIAVLGIIGCIINESLVALLEPFKAATTGSINGHAWVDLGLSVKWATMNVGAGSPGDYGDYFAWGEVHPKPEYNKENSVTYMKYIAGSICGNSQYDSARYHWGGSWRLPTEEEFAELKKKCRWIRSKENGHEGYTVVGPNGNSIFLPAAGYRGGSSTYNVGTYGGYWSGSLDEDRPWDAFYLSFDDETLYLSLSDAKCHVFCEKRYDGRSVRPVSD